MVYETVAPSAPIRQGDIFRDVPRVDVSLSSLALLNATSDLIEATTWLEALARTPTATEYVAVLPLKPVNAIVISQDCDTVRGEFLSLCEIVPFAQVNPDSLPTSPKKWQRLIRAKTREQLRYFYLPSDPTFGLDERMAADLRMLICTKRTDLENLREKRLGRLVSVADEHFREHLAQFFRRYPYNEWYPFTRDEFEAYQEELGESVSPYPWQMDSPAEPERS